MFKTKLGKNKGVERSRIWIEGKRLSGAGFHAKATKYTANWNTNLRSLVLMACDDGERRVSGKGSHPIIDITGSKVVEAFNGCEYVNVEYLNGVIKITACEA